eukprot:1159357-Pelagomonas_calceolata.AAC.7
MHTKAALSGCGGEGIHAGVTEQQSNNILYHHTTINTSLGSNMHTKAALTGSVGEGVRTGSKE